MAPGSYVSIIVFALRVTVTHVPALPMRGERLSGDDMTVLSQL